eukprot:CAMPEP_0194033518 /NCGR_PEP_ID=MMETSP0009_2-20130614/6181_1 /TAXON_ID=210454 /ORGANISM="Grammatophora oceanica, Strain CCMP 410" /LENGTH=531 /DNA_ID=CAMNT_0038674227 /DNA_START=155 /DNA_END=1750 /DNA_ORIENTATION=+
MWNALRSDLQDFVSGVADETKEVTERLDIAVPQALSGDAVDTSQESTDVDDSGVMADTDNSMALDEVDRRMNDETTYTLELDESDPSVESFLKDFDLESKTDEIAQLLQDHPDTLHRYFEEFVPTQVSYKEFWTRYFYRCDAVRIEDEWERQQEQAREAAAKALEGGLKTVSNLFGGALQSVSQTLKAAEQSAGEHRPPFVLNTAVSEDDEEEEEELGWGDDDSFDDVDNGEESNANETQEEQDSEEVITFADTQMEETQQKLTQALEERDQLQKTVEMQAQEIKSMQSGQAVPKEVEDLKMKLFEKDSELAALKASREDDDDGDASAGERTSKLLDEKTRELEEALSKLATAEQVVKEKDELLSSQVADSASQEGALIKQLQSEKAALIAGQKATEEKRQTEVAALKKELADCKSAASSKADDLSNKLKTATERTSTVEKQLEQAKSALAQAASEFSKEMEEEVAKMKQAHAAELAKMEQELEAKFKGEVESTGSSAGATTDTGVKVGTTSPIAARPVGTGDEEDWGDDW